MQYAFQCMVYSSYYKYVFQHNVNSDVEYEMNRGMAFFNPYNNNNLQSQFAIANNSTKSHTAQEQDCMSEFNNQKKKKNRNKLKMVVK